MSTAERAMTAPCSPAGSEQPSTTSSTYDVSRSLRSRSAASAGTALVVLCERHLAGPCSELSLELQRAQAHFGGAPGAPALLEGLEVAAAVLRERNGSTGGTAHARLSVRPPPA